ncbi:hypothetical protein EDB80DRAFT_880429 [Ilyonectria destructans]|nr:hypothetical protein EDB80DRAFT_880429 [Ilyonectria destructans]
MSLGNSHFHESLALLGDARPTALKIVRDAGLVGRLTDKVFLLTGCSSGIGIEMVRSLSATGATLYLTVRNIPAAQKALGNLLEPGRIELIEMDLSSLSSVRTGARAFLSKSNKLNVLICNAGVMAISALETTVDGFETQFGTNHLGHFFLFQLLKSTLLASSSASFQSRVVMVSSSAHRGGDMRIGDYNYRKSPLEYNEWAAYSQSKIANIYMANEIERRYGLRGLHAVSLMPGVIMTGLQKHMDSDSQAKYKADEEIIQFAKSPEQGAATAVWAAIANELENKGGVYLEDCRIVGLHPIEGDSGQSPKYVGYARHAFDKEKEGRLWVDSLQMVGLKEV